jgi:hypothetical protein
MGIERLDDAALAKLIDLSFDFVCSRRVGELVDPERVLAGVDALATEARAEAYHRRITVPMRQRLVERAKASTVQLGAWLPEPARDRIAELLGRPEPIPQKWIDQAVASEAVRDQIRDSLRDSISSFIKNAGASLGGGGGGGGGAGGALMGAFGLGARAFGAAGKAVLGGFGEELQKQLQDKVKDFVDGAVGGVQDRIAKKLADPKTAEEIGKRRRKGFLKTLERTESDAAKLFSRAPHAEIDALTPSIVAHNLARAEIRDVIRAEVVAVVAELSTQTIGELLDEAGLRELVRQALHAQVLPLAKEAAQTPEFQAWWGSVR